MEVTTLSAPQALLTIGVIALVTLLTRALPFALFPADKPTPPYVLFIGRALPYAIMVMLVVYCLRGVEPLAPPHGIPEAAALLAVAGLYVWRRNSLLAIGAGTALYMVLVQQVFV